MKNSGFVKAFSILIGACLCAIGVLMILGGKGVGPCGRDCGLLSSLLTLVGQPAYNVLIGLVWLALGCVFFAVPWLRKR